jgi:hydrogenase expression/formation protein HypC
MCIGIPMQVLQAGEYYAQCQGPEGVRAIDMRLVGPQAPGSWVLVFIDAAREVLDAERALLIQDALLALDQAMDGSADLDRWFPDLANREPQLPDFLKSPL